MSNVISILKTSFQILTVGLALIALFSLVQITQNVRNENARQGRTTDRSSEIRSSEIKRTQNHAPKKSLEVSQVR